MQTQEIEIHLLLEAIHKRYGFDFSGYSKDVLTKRIQDSQEKSAYNTISEMIPEVLYNPEFFDQLIYNISIPVTEMFRDPPFYQCLQEKVLPLFHSLPYIKIWHAGCASGQEVYSLAILLHEAGLYNKSQIYATDINDNALKQAQDGVYPINDFAKYTANYQQAGGLFSFSDYYHAENERARIDHTLKENITFANHNLATESVFGEMHLILCRNVFIYFESSLQNHVVDLFLKSLHDDGFLCLGTSETLQYTDACNAFREINGNLRIYQKKQDLQSKNHETDHVEVSHHENLSS